jgi:hypothetical protein
MSPGALQGDNRVLELRGVRIVHDPAHFLTLLAHPLLEAGPVVSVADTVKRRHLVRQAAGVREGVFGHVTSPAILSRPIIPDGHYMGSIL